MTKNKSGRAARGGASWASEPLTWFLGTVSVLYLVVLFPLCFFRHDDWWILGNSALHLPGDWAFLWRPTLYWGSQEIVWFFRPFFKLFTFLFYEAFRFNYYLWLTTLFLVFLATLAVGHRALNRFAGKIAADTFALFFLCAVPLHLGSLAWIGEGMMNVPQGLLLMVATAAWLDLGKEKKFRWNATALWVGLACITLSLGFKESTIFHLALFAGLALSEQGFEVRKRHRVIVAYFLPFAVLAAVYLGVRLGLMSWNQSYRPEFSAELWAKSFARVATVPVLAVTAWVFLDSLFDGKRWTKWGAALVKRAWWLPYFGVSTIVYLGQNFFSPGWWYLPSMTLALLVALCQKDVGAPMPLLRIEWGMTKHRAAFGSLLLFVALSAYKLDSMGWWHWGKLQRQFHQMVLRANPEEVRYMTVYNCEEGKYADIGMPRVVGDMEAIRNQWELVHRKPMLVTFRYCYKLASDRRNPASMEKPGEAVFAWRFPEVEALGGLAKKLWDASASESVINH